MINQQKSIKALMVVFFMVFIAFLYVLYAHICPAVMGV
ncbi:hypothetical protein F889_02140 [Acinetobacter colistiniresistens]|uniref:Uncharacterized protein n=1 Tax=Acinetobacter colistiniresistens TaxID=280145 RepID=N9R4D3_9GAMM|nr:hypothetical protein F889_02140 [Acinetobacter colistiniresistens]